MVGYQFCLDNPAETSPILMKKFDLDAETFLLFYQLYGAINTFVPFIIGLNMNRFGPYKCLLWCVIMTTIGETIMMLGADMDHYSVMLGGRLVFATGSETLFVV
tara:strand:- start:179 stop:490 length:312 start_codon:yes stop_codon:yes gene_type:complete